MSPAFRIAAAALALSVPLEAFAKNDAKVTADVSGPSTRLVVTFERSADCRVAQVAAKLEVTCADRVAFEPAEGKVADGIVEGWKAEGDRNLVVLLGPGYRRHESFDLKNPARLVLDVEGKRAAVAAVPVAPAAPRRAGPVVVVDPGHGGVETGALGPSGAQEKEITLDLARRLATRLERDGVTAVLTRDDDRILGLDDRTAVANHNKAELFVSIHLNAARGKKALGAETYYLATDATDDEARTLAGLENKGYAGAGSTPAPTSAGETPDPSLELILWDLAQNRYLEESARLAEAVQREMNELTGTRDRGVRQAPFRVLMGATMPAILVEVGFISNPEEEARFKDDAYKDKVVEALARAIGAFRARTEGAR
ncbi:MAG TPA: N-acetylmuramoyl-L-alanine amidase [Candidatus Polarisedimenticolaceae bacterium]